MTSLPSAKYDEPERVSPVELLSPAKDLECGIQAILHGADAVYIGAPRHSARAAAGNSIEDIRQLTAFAHIYNARVYVALNTILRDDELPDVERMIWQLYKAGVDALIVQDMAILTMHLPPIPLHASTQTDNRTVEKVQFLARAGFTRVVLARELSLAEIASIHSACPEVELEVFVHGALCVSLSGQCYASHYCFSRSANRGECAQFCRMEFSLEDANGNTIVCDKHLLSLRDLNQSENLEALIDAGVVSLKIEGRLKDVAYVKNVTAYYHQRLQALAKKHPGIVRTSIGDVKLSFTPQPEKSFSRGFTEYFLHRRNPDIFSPDTPKSLGEGVGTVREVCSDYITVSSEKTFNNGDGLCYVDSRGKLQGFRVNIAKGDKIFPLQMPDILPKTRLYRNFDQKFNSALQRKSADRFIPVDISLTETPFGFAVQMKARSHLQDTKVTAILSFPKRRALSSQSENIKTQLTRLGGTPFEVQSFTASLAGDWFIPSSKLSSLRREAVQLLLSALRISYRRPAVIIRATSHQYITKTLSYLGNVYNSKAEQFYRQHGVTHIDPAFEAVKPEAPVLMFCKHCLRYSLGLCHRHVPQLYLVSRDHRRFPLEFDCNQCQMKIHAES